jgi:hypothetical protein
VIIGQKSNVAAYQDLVGLANVQETVWEEVPVPRNHHNPPPGRQVAVFPEVTSWDACDAAMRQAFLHEIAAAQVLSALYFAAGVWLFRRRHLGTDR